MKLNFEEIFIWLKNQLARELELVGFQTLPRFDLSKERDYFVALLEKSSKIDNDDYLLDSVCSAILGRIDEEIRRQYFFYNPSKDFFIIPDFSCLKEDLKRKISALIE